MRVVVIAALAFGCAGCAAVGLPFYAFERIATTPQRQAANDRERQRQADERRAADRRAVDEVLAATADEREQRARTAAYELHLRALQAASRSDCDRVERLGHQVESVHAKYHQLVFRPDRRLAACVRSPASAPPVPQHQDDEEPAVTGTTAPKDHEACQRWRSARIRDAAHIEDPQKRALTIRELPPCQ